MLEGFLRLRKLFLTTKRTKVTKDWDHFSCKTFFKLRDLRGLRGKDCLSVFGCGSAALGLGGEKGFVHGC